MSGGGFSFSARNGIFHSEDSDKTGADNISSPYYHQKNNKGIDILTGGCDYDTEANTPNHYFGIFHDDDSSEQDYGLVSPLLGSAQRDIIQYFTQIHMLYLVIRGLAWED